MPRTIIGRWQVTRTSGERVVFEGATEREAELLARESFPGDHAFQVQFLDRLCEWCRTRVPGDGRCEVCHARREARKHSYLVKVQFLVRGGWTAPYEARVRAMGVAGATALGVREAKRASVRPRARIAQTKIEIVSVRK